ncbi:MAG: 3'(2'),5'-bisphosphate nucleotidase CysQ [Alphaproteobacteria bacterium]|nr:MAG: 3'(2'),5'-bisphosphate nucleotidase CysQ [Alphaproteobacteria bacterium]
MSRKEAMAAQLSERRHADLDILRRAVTAGGQLAATLQSTQPRAWRKADGTMVSEADLAVDRLLGERLRQARPDYGWWSEESGYVPPRERAPVWLVDPIDGTRSYLKGRADWCVAGALLEDGRPVLAAVAEPESGSLFWAMRGEGAYRDGEALHVSNRRELAQARAFADRGRLARKAAWRQPWPPLRHHSIGSFILRLARIAAGEADLLLSFTPKAPWDIAPGQLLVEEAGGVLRGTPEAPLRFVHEEESGQAAEPKDDHPAAAAGPVVLYAAPASLIPALKAQLAIPDPAGD